MPGEGPSHFTILSGVRLDNMDQNETTVTSDILGLVREISAVIKELKKDPDFVVELFKVRELRMIRKALQNIAQTYVKP